MNVRARPAPRAAQAQRHARTPCRSTVRRHRAIDAHRRRPVALHGRHRQDCRRCVEPSPASSSVSPTSARQLAHRRLVPAAHRVQPGAHAATGAAPSSQDPDDPRPRSSTLIADNAAASARRAADTVAASIERHRRRSDHAAAMPQLMAEIVARRPRPPDRRSRQAPVQITDDAGARHRAQRRRRWASPPITLPVPEVTRPVGHPRRCSTGWCRSPPASARSSSAARLHRPPGPARRCCAASASGCSLLAVLLIVLGYVVPRVRHPGAQRQPVGQRVPIALADDALPLVDRPRRRASSAPASACSPSAAV